MLLHCCTAVLCCFVRLLDVSLLLLAINVKFCRICTNKNNVALQFQHFINDQLLPAVETRAGSGGIRAGTSSYVL